MATVTIHAAKTQLSKLIERAEAGEEVIIARGKTPVIRLVPIGARAQASVRRHEGQGLGGTGVLRTAAGRGAAPLGRRR